MIQNSFTIEDIQKILEKKDLDCNLQPQDEQFPLKRLLVYLGLDHKERVKILEIILSIQDFGEELSDTPRESQKFAKITFLLPLPFPVKETLSPQTISLLHLLNRHLELPGFHVIEEEGKIYYKYDLLTHIETLNETLLLSIIGMIMVTISLFSQTIELIASGEMTQNELLELLLTKEADN